MSISLGTFWMLRIAEDPAVSAGELIIFLIVMGRGTAVALLFLLALIDVFVDAKLEAREHTSPEI